MSLEKRNFIFLAYVLFFALDAIINYFYEIPVYVTSLIIFVCVLVIPGFFSTKHYLSFLVVFSIFFIPFTFNVIKTGLNKESISDLLYIISFFGAFYLFSDIRGSANTEKKLINIFCVICLGLFLVTFIGFDQNLWGNTLDVETKDIEYSRAYRQGFFRKAHIASYFFTYLALYYTHKLKLQNAPWYKYLLIGLPLLSIILLTGSRTPIVVISLSALLFYFRIKYIKFMIPLISVIVGLFVFIDQLLVAFNHTIFYQYLSVIKTLTSNFERLSRVIIWSSWWQEVKTFSVIEILFGRGFHSSLEANFNNLSIRIWFHNDFLSIVYSYGILPLLAYVTLFVMIYKKHKDIIKSDMLLFIAFSSFWLSAFFNGFYYYYTILILYLFYAMIRNYHKRNIEE